MQNEQLKKSDFRICEHNGEFEIQRIKTTVKHTGYLWWKKTETITEWIPIDIYGNHLWYSYNRRLAIGIGNHDLKEKKFKSLGDAYDKVVALTRKRKYHYL